MLRIQEWMSPCCTADSSNQEPSPSAVKNTRVFSYQGPQKLLQGLVPHPLTVYLSDMASFFSPGVIPCEIHRPSPPWILLKFCQANVSIKKWKSWKFCHFIMCHSESEPEVWPPEVWILQPGCWSSNFFVIFKLLLWRLSISHGSQLLQWT